MKIFLDSNVWVSAFATRGLCEEIVRSLLRRHELGTFELLLGEPVKEETLRILVEKFHATERDLVPVRSAMDIASFAPASPIEPPSDIPDPDDVPVIACALESGADLFFTGDKELLAMNEIGGMPILSPRDAWKRLFQDD